MYVRKIIEDLEETLENFLTFRSILHSRGIDVAFLLKLLQHQTSVSNVKNTIDLLIFVYTAKE